MLRKEWEEYNSEILESIKNIKQKVEPDNKVIKFISLYQKNIADEKILGEIGFRLLEFFRHTKNQNPEYSLFVANLLGYECIDEVINLFEILKFCNKKKLDQFVPRLKFLLSSFKKENFPLNGRTINDPFMTNTHIRFLDKESLWPCRNTKKKQIISNWKNKNSNISENLNWDVFTCYHHNSNKINYIKSQLEKRKKTLMQLNCSQMVGEIDEALDKLSQESLDKNYGFRRITLTNIANTYRDLHETEDDIVIIPVNKDIYDRNSVIANFVDVCDNFPSLNNQSVFDHYGLVGSVKIQSFVVVAERDTQTYFLGYANHE